MAQNTRKIAVLTGDLVNSTGLGPTKIERAFAALEDCAATQAGWMGESLHFTRHRGDGWQVALVEPKYALRSALAFRAALRAEGSEFDSYIGIAEGDITGPLEANLNDQTDNVFTKSGQMLEWIKTEAHLELTFGHAATGAKSACAILLGHMSQDWTPAQAAPLIRMLHPTDTPTYTEIAKALGKSRQAVAKALDSAGFRSIYAALNDLEGDESHA
ncbi:MAG: hypothetical protein KJ731_20325 [Alphaproteobacteria bacterium]|nr:hypothetical protein [Alphaproteobacteria bacterium]MBU1281392.1 hypothetical protein [Alphaproteobacteria bacterium]MBU1574149.1 hypothetical protein [Alphaproteobacteria bacterium]MBU1830797.1 hypothetical protein [Alphaproteobacteria bacterium]MBU2076589.1 hypothetical protein [Alphaproteobacteria bacterium]